MVRRATGANEQNGQLRLEVRALLEVRARLEIRRLSVRTQKMVMFPKDENLRKAGFSSLKIRAHGKRREKITNS